MNPYLYRSSASCFVTYYYRHSRCSVTDLDTTTVSGRQTEQPRAEANLARQRQRQTAHTTTNWPRAD